MLPQIILLAPCLHIGNNWLSMEVWTTGSCHPGALEGHSAAWAGAESMKDLQLVTFMELHRTIANSDTIW